MSRIYVAVYIYNGIVGESKAFEDENKSYEYAFELAKRWKQSWFRDAYLKDWMDVVEYQSQLDHSDVEILVAYTEFEKSGNLNFCDEAIQWLRHLFTKEKNYVT